MHTCLALTTVATTDRTCLESDGKSPAIITSRAVRAKKARYNTDMQYSANQSDLRTTVTSCIST